MSTGAVIETLVEVAAGVAEMLAHRYGIPADEAKELACAWCRQRHAPRPDQQAEVDAQIDRERATRP